MSLTTPEKIRTLQRKLYRKAKAEPAFRFYLLYDKIHREDILGHAYELARANAGAAGVDGITFARIETLGLEAWLAGLRKDFVSKTYRPDPSELMKSGVTRRITMSAAASSASIALLRCSPGSSDPSFKVRVLGVAFQCGDSQSSDFEPRLPAV
jgi:hypothetical protein